MAGNSGPQLGCSVALAEIGSKFERLKDHQEETFIKLSMGHLCLTPHIMNI